MSLLVASYVSDQNLTFFPLTFSASFPSGPATEQSLDVRFRSTASWIFTISDFLVVRDNWGDTQQIMLSQGKWKLTIAAPASDLFVVWRLFVCFYLRNGLNPGISVVCLAKTSLCESSPVEE